MTRTLLALALFVLLRVDIAGSLRFGSAGDRVDHGSAASLDDLPTGGFSGWAWIQTRAILANQYIVTKDGTAPTNGWLFLLDNDGGTGTEDSNAGLLRLLVWRATGFADFQSTNLEIRPTSKVFHFVAFSWDDAASPKVHFYHGDERTMLIEMPLKVSTGGSGAMSDGATNVYVGASQRDGTNTFKGLIGTVALVNRVLGMAELERVRKASRYTATLNQARVTGTVLLADYRHHGTQDDWSFNSNTGAITQATLEPDHLPMGRVLSALDVPAAAAAGTKKRLTMLGAGD